jgi:hypothetical protein
VGGGQFAAARLCVFVGLEKLEHRLGGLVTRDGGLVKS